jgi:hypothetical protein
MPGRSKATLILLPAGGTCQGGYDEKEASRARRQAPDDLSKTIYRKQAPDGNEIE